jgi:hypothetical protein
VFERARSRGEGVEVPLRSAVEGSQDVVVERVGVDVVVSVARCDEELRNLSA